MKRANLSLLLPLLLLASCGEAALSSSPSFSYEPLVGDPYELGGENLSIIVASDIHYISPKVTDGGSAFVEYMEKMDGKLTVYSEEIVDAFVEEVIAKKPYALLLTGDLTWNGAYESNVDFAAKLKTIEDAGIQVLAIPGNHDINSPEPLEFIGPSIFKTRNTTAEEFKKIYRSFGYDQAIRQDPSSFSYLYQLSDKVYVLAIDVNSQAQGYLSGQADTFARSAIKYVDKLGGKLLTMTHQNTLVQCEAFSGQTFINVKYIRDAMKASSSLLANLSGHMHIQHQAKSHYREILTSALSVYPCQYGNIEITPSEAHYETRKLDMQAYAEAHQNEDPFLLNFNEKAKQKWHDHFFRQGRDHAIDMSEENRNLLGECFAAFNMAYFEGYSIDTTPYQEAISLYQSTQTGSYINALAKEFALGVDHRAASL